MKSEFPQASFLLKGELVDHLEQTLQEDIESSRLSPSFRAFYQIRGLLPIFVRQLLQRVRNQSADTSFDQFMPNQLIEFLDRENITLNSIWPNSAEFSLVLTHDVETKRGLDLIEPIAQLEEELGFRSCWYIIPHKYKTDPGLIRDLKRRGHEIGVHGYNHDGKLFFNEEIFNSRVPGINRAMDELGATGFRAPMVHRNMHWLQQLNIDYDASCFDVDPFQAMSGGVGSFWPFVFGKFVELPYTLPQDHTLLVTLRQTTDDYWRQKLATIRRLHGMALMVTHPDYLDTRSRLNVYGDFLRYIRDETSPWHVLPQEMATWCRSFMGHEQRVDQKNSDYAREE